MSIGYPDNASLQRCVYMHALACTCMLHSRLQLTSIKQLQGSFTTHLVCAVHCYSGCPLQSISTMVLSLSLSKPPSLSSFSSSTIPYYPTFSSSYFFLILSVISVSILHPCLSHISPPFSPHLTQALNPLYYSPSPQFNRTLPYRPAAALSKH